MQDGHDGARHYYTTLHHNTQILHSSAQHMDTPPFTTTHSFATIHQRTFVHLHHNTSSTSLHHSSPHHHHAPQFITGQLETTRAAVAWPRIAKKWLVQSVPVFIRQIMDGVHFSSSVAPSTNVWIFNVLPRTQALNIPIYTTCSRWIQTE